MMATQIQDVNQDQVADQALLALLRLLKARDYRFVTPTPTTHARVVARPDRVVAHTIEDVLGWSLPFADDRIDREALQLLRAADAIEMQDGRWRSRLRVSSLGERLLRHAPNGVHARRVRALLGLQGEGGGRP